MGAYLNWLPSIEEYNQITLAELDVFIQVIKERIEGGA